MPYPPLPYETLTGQQEGLLVEAEQAVQKIVARLAERLEEHGLKIDDMELDTRNFAGLRVSIFTRPI